MSRKPVLDEASIVLVRVPPAAPHWPSVRMDSVAEYLAHRDHNVVSLDPNATLFRELDQQQRQLWTPGPSLDQIAESFTSGEPGQRLDRMCDEIAISPALLVGLYVDQLGLGVAIYLARALMARNIRIAVVAFGPGTEREEYRKELLAGKVDYLVLAEDELTFDALAEPLLGGRDAPPTPGVIPASFRDEFPYQEPQPADLRQLPLPSYRDLSLEDYVPPPQGRYLQLATSRGVIHRDLFHGGPDWQGPYRAHDPEAIADHLSWLARTHKVEQVQFVDPMLNGDPEALRSWCEGVLRYQLGIIWSCRCGFVEGMTPEVLAAMRLAGCISVEYLLPSGSDALLSAIDAGFDTDLASRVLRTSHEAGLRTELSLLVGVPGETDEDFQRTQTFLKQHRDCLAQVRHIATCELRPGSALARAPEDFGVQPEDGQLTRIHYTDAAGNTARDRNRRAQELAATATSQGLPVVQMLDDNFRSGSSNADLEAAQAQMLVQRHQELTIDHGGLQLTIDELAMNVALRQEQAALTEAPGFGALLHVDGRAVDMSCGSWTVERTEDGALLLEVALLFLPARMRLRVAGGEGAEELELSLELVLEQPMRLERVRVGLFLSPALRRYVALAGSGDLDLPSSGRLEERISGTPSNYLVLAGAQDDPRAPALSLKLTDSLFWEAHLARDPRGRRLLLSRQLDYQASGQAVQPGTHCLFSARLAAVPAAEVVPYTELTGQAAKDDPLSAFALVVCPPWHTGTAPLWPALLASNLRDAGYSGTCHDLNTAAFRQLSQDAQELWSVRNLSRWRQARPFERQIWPAIEDALREPLAQVLALRPRVVGLTATESNLRCTIRVAEMIREASPETTIVLGGPGVFWTVEKDDAQAPRDMFDPWTGEYLDPDGVVDLFLRGEADLTFPQLLHRLRHNQDPLEVPGAVAHRQGRWLGLWESNISVALDELPFPDFTDLALPSFPGKRAPLLTSRGCFRSCAFCNDCRMQGQYRRRTAENLMREVRQLHDAYGIEGLEIVDLLLNGDIKELTRFSELMADSGLELTWGGQALVRPEMDRTLLEKMARGGCKELIFGLESFSQPVVDTMRKGYSVKEARQVLKDAHEAGIETAINLLVGFPRETPQEFQETVDALKSLAGVITRLEAINPCHITYASRLWTSPQLFGIDSREGEFWTRWQGPFKNTEEERRRRVEVLRSVARELGIGVPEADPLLEDPEQEGLVRSF